MSRSVGLTALGLRELGILDHELLFTGAIELYDDLQIVPAAASLPDHPDAEVGMPDAGSGIQAIDEGLILVMLLLMLSMFGKDQGRRAPGFPRILDLQDFRRDFIQEP